MVRPGHALEFSAGKGWAAAPDVPTTWICQMHLDPIRATPRWNPIRPTSRDPIRETPRWKGRPTHPVKPKL